MAAAIKLYATQYRRPKVEEQPEESGDSLAPVKGISWGLLLGGLLWLVMLTLVIFLIG
jgi:hypothetical protein